MWCVVRDLCRVGIWVVVMYGVVCVQLARWVGTKVQATAMIQDAARRLPPLPTWTQIRPLLQWAAMLRWMKALPGLVRMLITKL